MFWVSANIKHIHKRKQFLNRELNVIVIVIVECLILLFKI